MSCGQPHGRHKTPVFHTKQNSIMLRVVVVNMKIDPIYLTHGSGLIVSESWVELFY